MEFYHRFDFTLYGIPLIDRKKYIKIDRYKLEYLGTWDKVNCAYCGYVNGVLRYAVEIAAKTEQYWCGIKHKNDNIFIESEHHKNFLEHGDEVEYKAFIGEVKEENNLAEEVK